MRRSSRPLTTDERQEVADWVAFGLRSLSFEPDSDIAEEIQHILQRVIDGIHCWDAEKREAKLVTASLCLGLLWGQTVCDRVGWEWAIVSLGSDWEGYGIVSSTRSHVVLPVQYVRGLLKDPERDQTSRALYLLLKAGLLPPSEPGELLVLR